MCIRDSTKTVDDYSGYAQEGNMAVQARTRMDGICEKPDGEWHRLSLLLTQLCTTGLQRLGKMCIRDRGKPPVAKKIKYLNQFELHTLLISLDLKLSLIHI